MLLCLGFNLMEAGSQLLCPRKDMPGSIWRPGFWQRRHVMYTSIWLFIILLLALEFSFSSLFAMHPIMFMLLFKVVWMYMEVWLLKALTEKMVALPFECGLQTIQYLMTLGATSFLAFIYANLVELGVMVFMRITVHPIKFRLQRVLKFKVAQQNAARQGLPVPVNTPELEAIGIMSDMLGYAHATASPTRDAAYALRHTRPGIRAPARSPRVRAPTVPPAASCTASPSRRSARSSRRSPSSSSTSSARCSRSRASTACARPT
jgi:hypothetical protein